MGTSSKRLATLCPAIVTNNAEPIYQNPVTKKVNERFPVPVPDSRPSSYSGGAVIILQRRGTIVILFPKEERPLHWHWHWQPKDRDVWGDKVTVTITQVLSKV